MANLADKIKKALEDGRSGQYVKKSPYERFGLKYNPFRQNIQDMEPLTADLHIVREDVSVDFAVKLGNAIRLFEQDQSSRFRHFLVHGLRGGGKSCLARQFHRDWANFGFNEFKTLYSCLSDWSDPTELTGPYDASKSTLATYEEFLDQIRRMDKALIVFLDDIDFMITGNPAIPRLNQFMQEIEAAAPHGVILIGFLGSLTLAVLLELDQQSAARDFYGCFSPDHFFYPVFSTNEIRRMIQQRLQVVRRPTDLFSSRAIDHIASHSLGLPAVALRLATACLDELIIQDQEKVTAAVSNFAIKQLGYEAAVRLVEVLDTPADEEVTSVLSLKRREIIASILDHQTRERFFFPPTEVDGLRSSDLADQFAVNLSTMNYHLKPLTSSIPIPILRAKDDAHDGRSKIYYVDWQSPVTAAAEIITVFHRLTQERFHIAPEALLITRREVQ
ncbi:MAG: hypothetical protein ACFFE8_00280 [Candidatus Heimdallarchaeota archaeon]